MIYTKNFTLKFDKTNGRKVRKRRYKEHRPAYLYTQESHKNSKLEVIIYAKRTLLCRHAETVHMCIVLCSCSMCIHMSFAHIDLKGLILLVSSLPSGP